MCFHLAATSAAKTLEARFNASFPDANLFEPAEEFNAFAHPVLPVITSHKPELIELFHWGLVPAWVRDAAFAEQIRKRTLNARLETAYEKPSFQESYRLRRCLIPATAFYEWQHVNGDKIKTKDKVKYKITTDQEIFAFAGLWDTWKDPKTHEEWNGFSILTMPANPLMERIHNSAKRMPLIIKPENEKEWLNTDRIRPEHLEKLIVPYPEELMHAEKVL
jgi:putative SOS response-associated peptidase YedK